jgi:hypothetical protein
VPSCITGLAGSRQTGKCKRIVMMEGVLGRVGDNRLVIEQGTQKMPPCHRDGAALWIQSPVYVPPLRRPPTGSGWQTNNIPLPSLAKRFGRAAQAIYPRPPCASTAPGPQKDGDTGSLCLDAVLMRGHERVHVGYGNTSNGSKSHQSKPKRSVLQSTML